MTLPMTLCVRWKVLAAALLALVLAACAGKGVAAHPALYKIEHASRAGSTAGWLFGTFHALPKNVRWQTPELEAAMAEAGVLVVEVKALDDRRATASVMAELSRTAGLPPLMQRVPAADRAALRKLYEDAGIAPGQFAGVETWAAALALSGALAAEAGLDSASGTDLGLLKAFSGRPVVGLETAREQLSLFDRMSGNAQMALLQGLVESAGDGHDNPLADAWMRGDVARLAAETEEALANNAELRATLLTNRNRRWMEAIVPLLARGQKPLVAVGAGHLGGHDGLIPMLEARGWTVTRVR
jgi:uncharacterized protein YbaP (TraB family)